MAASASLAAVVIPGSMLGSAGAAPAITGHGIEHCGSGWAGTETFVSPLKKGALATAPIEIVYLRATAKCTGSGKSHLATIFGRGVITRNGANDCLAVFAPSPPGGVRPIPFAPRFWETISWAAAVVANTTVTFPLVNETTPAAAVGRVNTSGVGAAAVGSYAMAGASQSIFTVKSDAVIMSAGPGDCGNAAGVSVLAISPVGTTGTF